MTQKQFYRTKAWQRARDAYIKKRKALDGGMCEVCGERLGYIVHHKMWLNDANCSDPEISLNEDNFRYECLDCHNKEKNPAEGSQGRCFYGINGEVLKRGEY